MITFFSIFAVLMIINILLLTFSVNGAMDSFKRAFKKISDDTVIKLPPAEFSETKYKKAV